jgi:hypothetical protein
MDWIKRRYDQFILLLMALVLLGVSILLILRASAFEENFISGVGRGTDEVTPLDTARLDQALQDLQQPKGWTAAHGSLFVSEKYIVRDGQLVNVDKDRMHEPVPNEWFEEHGLDILDSNILQADADGDGFNNLEEWQAKTDPRNKEKHPPYVTKLRLVKEYDVQFRLVFMSYVNQTFQINTLDVTQPTQFVNMGEIIPGTDFKISRFEEKKRITGEEGSPIEKDVSELTLIEVRLRDPDKGDVAKMTKEELQALKPEDLEETGKTVTLVLEQIVNSPDTYAEFIYLFNGQKLNLQEGQIFTLPPEGSKYKFIDIEGNEAVIEQVDTGEKIKVPRSQ